MNNTNKSFIYINWFNNSNQIFDTLEYILNNYNLGDYNMINITKDEVDRRIADFVNWVTVNQELWDFSRYHEYEYDTKNAIDLENFWIFIDSLYPNKSNLHISFLNDWIKQSNKKYYYIINYMDLLNWKKTLPFIY